MGMFTSDEKVVYHLVDVEEGEQYEIPQPRHSMLRYIHPVFTLLCVWALCLSLFTQGPKAPPASLSPSHWLEPKKPAASATEAADFFKALYAPWVLDDLSLPPSISENGKMYDLAGNDIWTRPLRDQVLILDLDNRTREGSEALLQDEQVSADELENVPAGMLNHYMYSLVHGYDYKYIRVPCPLSQTIMWYKPNAIRQILANNPRYRFVILADSNFLWNHPEVPIEMLLNHWNITEETALGISSRPAGPIDPFGRNILDTGFIVAQNTLQTMHILRAWSDCPMGRYPGCEDYANQEKYEQTALNEFVRYEYDGVDDIRELPCSETAGDGSEGGCEGVFVRKAHDVDGVVESGGSSDPLVRLVNARLRDFFVRNKGEYFQDTYE